MHRPDHDSAVAVRPATAAAGTPGWFQDGNPAEGVRGTVLQADVMNDLLANCLAICAAGGVTPVKGNDNNLRDAILAMIAAGTVPTGAMLPFPSTAAPAGWARMDGALVPRAGGWANLYAYAVASGNIVSDGDWLTSRPGSFSTGDGSTTFRIPDRRGLFDRGFHNGSGTYDSNTGTAIGQYRDSQNKAHTHSTPQGLGGGAGGSSLDVGGNSVSSVSGSEGGVEGYPRHTTSLWCIKL